MLALRSAADAEAISGRVRAHLARGGLLAYPTETVYGVGSAPEADPLAALARLKGRPPRKPFLLLVSQGAQVAGLEWNEAARTLAQQFWPGPLTLALPGGEGRLPDALRGAEGGIAVRHTGHGPMARLIERLGHPVTSTSANQPGSPPAPGADGVEALFRSAVEEGLLLVLDGGVLGNVPPSTLVDCTMPVSRIIREGAIPLAELRRRTGRLAP